MSLFRDTFDSTKASQAMLDGLTTLIRDELRLRIMEKIEPDIDAALDAGLAAFKITIESYREPHNLRDVVRVLIERRDKA